MVEQRARQGLEVIEAEQETVRRPCQLRFLNHQLQSSAKDGRTCCAIEVRAQSENTDVSNARVYFGFDLIVSGLALQGRQLSLDHVSKLGLGDAPVEGRGGGVEQNQDARRDSLWKVVSGVGEHLSGYDPRYASQATEVRGEVAHSVRERREYCID